MGTTPKRGDPSPLPSSFGGLAGTDGQTGRIMWLILAGPGGPQREGPTGRFWSGPAGHKGRGQLADLGRARRPKQGGTNWLISVGPGGPNWGGPAGRFGRENRSEKMGAGTPPDPHSAPPLGTVTFSENP